MRARSLKPSLFKNEVLGTADPLLTILFEGLWCEADREGRLEDRPLRIRAEVFPYRDGIDIDLMLNWLVEHEFISRYRVGSTAIIQVIKFLDHQRPHTNEVASVLPTMDKAELPKVSRKNNQGNKSAQPRTQALRSDSGLLTPHSLTPDSLNHDQSEKPSAPPPVDNRAETVFQHWQREWKHQDAKLDPKRRKRIEARLKDFTPEQLCDAISGFKHSEWHTGTDPKGRGVVYDGIETLLRDTEQVEKGMRLFAHPPRPPPKEKILSPGERVAAAFEKANGNGRVVSEQFGSSGGNLEELGGHVWPALPS